MKATLSHTEIMALDVVTYWFRPERPVHFEAGQFIEIYVPHSEPDSRGEWREFSLSSSPQDQLLAITTSFPKNGSTFKRALKHLRPGSTVAMHEPMGDFILPKDIATPLIFVAAGLGSVPYVSMVKWLIARDERRPIQLIHSVSQPDGFIFHNLWQRYPLTFNPIVSQPDGNWGGLTGRLTVSRFLELTSPYQDKLIYLAGPQSFIEPFYNDLLEAGIPRAQLLLDYFPGY